MTGTHRPLISRLASKFTIGPDCWEWKATTDDNGYGRIHNPSGSCLAHVALYTLVVGPVPDGLELDHTCRRPACVRPAHLEPVTHKVNIQRAPRGHRGQQQLDQTHCKNGHEFTPENTYRRLGSRHCKTCKVASKRHHRALRREQ